MDTIKVKFDGKEYEVKKGINLVAAMDEHGIRIMAPCYRNKRNEGCCKVCMVEIKGQSQFACCYKPSEGDEVSYKRDDLIQARKEAAKRYAAGEVNDSCCEDSGCGCSTPSESSSCC